MEDLKSVSHPGTTIREMYLDVNENVSIRVIEFIPVVKGSEFPLVMVVGLSTIIESFKEIMLDLTEDNHIFYIETREKRTSRVRGKVDYGIGTHGNDIAVAIKKLGLAAGGYALMGYSMGATSILHSFSEIKPRPACLLLMEPTPVFHYPQWSLVLIRFSVQLYPVMKPLAKWYLRNFRINSKEDEEMVKISSRALDNADPRKLRDTILAIAGYKVWDKLGAVDCPALVVGTSKDKFHDHADIDRLAKDLVDCTYIDLETNKRTHSREMSQEVKKHLIMLSIRKKDSPPFLAGSST